MTVQNDGTSDDECVQGLTIGCSECRPTPARILAHRFRTKGRRAYHNGRDCDWLLKGQRQAQRQAQNVHEVARVAWHAVLPGELEPCEYCCTPDWLRRRQR